MERTRDKLAFQVMAQTGGGDAGALALGLRRGITGIGLRALAAKTLHVAAAAPERLADVYDNAAAGWLSGPVFPPRLRSEEPLPISREFWAVFWELVTLPAGKRNAVLADEILRLAGQLDPRIHARMARAALDFPGVAEAARDGANLAYDVDLRENPSPDSLAYALREAIRSAADEPSWRPTLPLRHMPPPLDYINTQIIQTLPLLSAVGGYGPEPRDEPGLNGFLTAQCAHHYSALATAVRLTILSIERPPEVEMELDCTLKGWAHGRETPALLGVDWRPLLRFGVKQARDILGVAAFPSPYSQPKFRR